MENDMENPNEKKRSRLDEIGSAMCLIGAIAAVILFFVTFTFEEGSTAVHNCVFLLGVAIVATIAGYRANKEPDDRIKLVHLAIPVVALVFVIFQIVGSSVKGYSALPDAEDEARESIQTLCERYGLDDAEIIIAKPSKKDGYYYSYVTVKTDKYMSLSAEDAFDFYYELQCGRIEKDDIDFEYSCSIESKGNKFTFRTDKSDPDGDVTYYAYIEILGQKGSLITAERKAVGDYRVTWSDTNYFK